KRGHARVDSRAAGATVDGSPTKNQLFRERPGPHPVDDAARDGIETEAQSVKTIESPRGISPARLVLLPFRYPPIPESTHAMPQMPRRYVQSHGRGYYRRPLRNLRRTVV